MRTKVSRNIRKKEAFSAFIKILKDGTVAHWQSIARAIGVDNDTITEWKKLPEAREAIIRGINNSLKGMERAGGKDWRMWESKLKMLGISPVDKIEQDITSYGKPIPILGGITSTPEIPKV